MGTFCLFAGRMHGRQEEKVTSVDVDMQFTLGLQGFLEMMYDIRNSATRVGITLQQLPGR